MEPPPAGRPGQESSVGEVRERSGAQPSDSSLDLAFLHKQQAETLQLNCPGCRSIGLPEEEEGLCRVCPLDRRQHVLLKDGVLIAAVPLVAAAADLALRPVNETVWVGSLQVASVVEVLSSDKDRGQSR